MKVPPKPQVNAKKPVQKKEESSSEDSSEEEEKAPKKPAPAKKVCNFTNF